MSYLAIKQFIIWLLIYLNIKLIITSDSKRPNIVFILADDLGWGDVSLHGSKQMKTPNIDVLASNGIILNNYYVSPICTPSRSALMTGYHPIHTGLQHNVIYNSQPWGLPLNLKILPQYLNELDYSCHAVGKWHLGFFKKDYLPTKRGFDSHFGFWTGHTDYYSRRSGKKGFDFRHNEKRVQLSNYRDMYLTDILTNKSIDIIAKNGDQKPVKPLFLYIAHNAVHSALKKDPLQASQEYINRCSHVKDTKRKMFCAMVLALDQSVGDVVAALRKANILNNTIIIFSTDNGGAIRGTGGWSIDNSDGSNWPLRGSKYTLFEGGIRGFAFIWSPLLKHKYESNHLMHVTDWLPTIYTAIGGKTQDLGSIDGIDMWNVLKDNLVNPRKQLLHNIDPIWKLWALRDGDYKLISGTLYQNQFNGWHLPSGEESLLTPFIDYKNSTVYKALKEIQFFVRDVQKIKINCNSRVKSKCLPKDNPCLFDLKADPCEYSNLFDEKPDIVDKMLKQLAAYNETAVKPCNQPNDDKANPIFHNKWWSVWM